MEKNVEISLLYSFYGRMLTERQADTVDLYYNEDLSLSEIAQHMGITRQGVSDLIRRSESELYGFEDKLKLYSRFEAINASAAKIRELGKSIAEAAAGQIKAEALEIITEAAKIEQLEA